MFNNEKQFEEYVNSLPLDDKINHQHKDKLEKLLLEKYPAANQNQNRSIIMRNKFTAAAVLLVAVGLFLLVPARKGQNTVQVLDNICKAESAFFETLGITHIVTEINVYPLPEEYRNENILTDDTPIEAMTGPDLWLKHNWLPTCSVKSNGQFRLNQLSVSPAITEQYKLTDQAWYDSETGYFKRIMADGDNVIMANAWDGRQVYEMFNEDGRLNYIAEDAEASFNPPANPSQFLGLTAGICKQIESQAVLTVNLRPANHSRRQ